MQQNVDKGDTETLNRARHGASRMIYTSSHRLVRRTSFASSSVLPDLAPCLKALRLPILAPLPAAPPCILHRRFPLTAGDWHSVPARVVAKQRGA